jgi:hypothetical protein
MKIRPVAAELFHEDGQTDITKLIVVFRNFANAPKNRKINHRHKKSQTEVCLAEVSLPKLTPQRSQDLAVFPFASARRSGLSTVCLCDEDGINGDSMLVAVISKYPLTTRRLIKTIALLSVPATN